MSNTSLSKDTLNEKQIIAGIKGNIKDLPIRLRRLDHEVLVIPEGLLSDWLEYRKLFQPSSDLLTNLDLIEDADLSFIVDRLESITNQLFASLDIFVKDYSDDFFEIIPMGSDLIRLETSAIRFQNVLNELNIHAQPSAVLLSNRFNDADAIGDLISTEGYPCLSWSVESFIDDIKPLKSIKLNQFDVYRDEIKAYRNSILSDIKLLKDIIDNSNLPPDIDLDLEGFINMFLEKELQMLESHCTPECASFTFLLKERLKGFTNKSDIASVSKDIQMVNDEIQYLNNEKQRLDQAASVFSSLVDSLSTARNTIKTLDIGALNTYWIDTPRSKLESQLRGYEIHIDSMLDQAYCHDYQSMDFEFLKDRSKNGRPVSAFELAWDSFIEPIQAFLESKKSDSEATK